MIKVLFVCLGNICRSPLAEGIFLHLIQQEGLQDKFVVDSAGTSGYHQGEMPDKRSIQVAQKHGIQLNSRSRGFKKVDTELFDYIIAMDKYNVSNVEQMSSPYGKAQLFLMRHFDSTYPDTSVKDPYYGDLKDFEECYQILLESCRGLLVFLKQKHHL